MKSTNPPRPVHSPHPAPRLVDPEIVNQVCLDLGIVFRRRLLDPLTTLNLLVIQALHRNTALTDLRRLGDLTASASAICRARARLPLAFFREVLARLGRHWQEVTRSVGLWHGHRVVLIDGTGCSMPDVAELREHYGQPPGQKAGCGFPVMSLLAVVHAGTGLLLEWLDSPMSSSEQAGAAEVVSRSGRGDVVVGDRAFGNYPMLARLVRWGVQGVLRVNQNVIVDFTPGRPHTHPRSGGKGAGLPRSRWLGVVGTHDQLVQWLRPAARPSSVSESDWASFPASLPVRELRYRVKAAGFRTHEVTLVTTLLDGASYPSSELAGLYFQRWGVEGHFAELKTAMKMDVLKCRSLDGVRKELATYALAYNLTHLSILEGARSVGVKPSRISFIDALRWLRAVAVRGWSGPPKLIVNPDRPGRSEPRVRKRRPKSYPLMKEPALSQRGRTSPDSFSGGRQDSKRAENA
jgi:hypothetical protein